MITSKGQPGYGMARPGRDVAIDVSAAEALPALVDALALEGFRQRSKPGQAPVVMQHGSRGATFVADVVSDVVPVSLMPSVMRTSMLVRARIRVSADAADCCTLRVDAQVLATSVMAVPRFLEALDAAAARLAARDWAVTLGEITDATAAKD